MSTLGEYSFLPWLRQGLANQIDSADGDADVKVRAQVTVSLEVRGDKVAGGTEAVPVTKDVALFGPGDIIGVDRRAIVRTEPRDWVTNFEPNYLPAIEFYDEDLPWRYTPAAPDQATGRLRPWLALIVLEESEFTDGQMLAERPLPYVEVTSLDPFPRADELWAWAHVHVNRSLAGSATEFVSHDMAAVLPRLDAVLRENLDLAYSRIVSPRKLEENKGYHAFLMPTFEAGRRAGLSIDLADVPATASAWDPVGRPEPLSFSYYHRWFFRTGANGDFETLVRLLVPKPVDPRVGFREMDVQEPGSGVPGVDNPDLSGVLMLGGALQPPDTGEPPNVFETWDDAFPRPLQVELAELINLPDRYQAEREPDPIVAPPLYGRWHALATRVLDERDGTPITPADGWVNRLNLDPRHRAAAGIGTRVIQDQQERYMDAAWEQVGRVLEAQRRVWLGQFGLLVSEVWYDRHLVPAVGVSRQQGLLLMAPLNKRVLSQGATLHHTFSQSLMQPAMTSAALRRVVRPRARLVRSLPFDDTVTPGQLIDRVNAGEVSAAPPKQPPAGAVTDTGVADAIRPGGLAGKIPAWLQRAPWLALVLLLVLLVLLILLILVLPVAGLVLLALLAAAAFVGYRLLARWRGAVQAADLVPSEQPPASVDALPGRPDFVISEPGAGFVPSGTGTDSVEAARFKDALRDTFGLRAASDTVGRPPQRGPVDLAVIAGDGVEAIRPAHTIPRRIQASIFVPPRIVADLVTAPGQRFVEPMAYPVIDQPMYEPLTNLSSELFLPNINLLEQNSVTLLETNQPFIESYMVGLNHEFARELLWREYLTDQRGSSFRQFWDVRSFFNAANLDDEALKEKLRDIPPLHRWATSSELGDHDHRELPGENEDELVLAIRGELLKRYPNAVIYAHRACWQREAGPGEEDLNPCERTGPIDNTVERRLASLTPAEELNPPTSKVLTPLYEAKVHPDIYFFGFDLTVTEAKGGDGSQPDHDPGWFFVIKERPGEPRFGFDTEGPDTLNVWNDVSWARVKPGAGPYLRLDEAPATLTLTDPGSADEKHPQFLDDRNVPWDQATMSAAELAYILFQAPVLVAFHAAEMLPHDGSTP